MVIHTLRNNSLTPLSLGLYISHHCGILTLVLLMGSNQHVCLRWNSPRKPSFDCLAPCSFNRGYDHILFSFGFTHSRIFLLLTNTSFIQCLFRFPSPSLCFLNHCYYQCKHNRLSQDLLVKDLTNKHRQQRFPIIQYSRDFQNIDIYTYIVSKQQEISREAEFWLHRGLALSLTLCVVVSTIALNLTFLCYAQRNFDNTIPRNDLVLSVEILPHSAWVCNMQL